MSTRVVNSTRSRGRLGVWHPRPAVGQTCERCGRRFRRVARQPLCDRCATLRAHAAAHVRDLTLAQLVSTGQAIATARAAVDVLPVSDGEAFAHLDAGCHCRGWTCPQLPEGGAPGWLVRLMVAAASVQEEATCS